MDCWNFKCSSKSKDIIVCTLCYMRSYCSEECRSQDWAQLHSSQCRKHQMTLNDVQVMPNSNVLGRGTYGEVQLVRHKITNQMIALKRIKKLTKDRKVPIKLLYREISVQVKLDHPHITRLYDHYETSEEVYLFLEYIDGGNLYTQIKKKIKFPEREACKYFFQICQGVNYLHQNRIIHRDLKPDNILLTRTGLIKICDFGWAVAASDDRTTYCGTLDYMAPEILKAINYSNKVDIWSLGVILFELLQGQTPFKARTPAERIQKITEKNLQFLVGVSTAAKAIIGKMLRNDPRERPSVEEILADEWILRYTAESPRAHGRRVSVFVEDEYEMKLNKHYPPAYHRKNVRTGKIPTVFFNTVKGENDDSGSDNSLYVEENKENKVFSVSTPAEISRKREELEKLQVKLEGKKDRSPSFFSKVFSVFGLV